MRDACVVIAVAEPDGLDALPGAVPSAKRFAKWAGGQGYDVGLVTDENGCVVTCAKLADTFHRLLGRGGQRRLLVAFIGHGLIRGASEEFWLLSDWRTKANEAVNHLKLRNRLETYGPKQIAVVSDACRSLPSDRAKWVDGNGVVDVTDYLEQPVEVANLSGTRSSQPAFQTPLGAEEQYCFFTQVLTNALLGSPADIVETDEQGRPAILNDRLFAVVERELPLLASRFRRRQIPQLEGAWRSPSPNNVWSVLSTSKPADGTLILPDPDDRGRDARYRSAAGQAGDLAEDARARTAAFSLRLRNEDRASRFETTGGIAVVGRSVRSVAAGPGLDMRRGLDDSRSWFALTASRPAGSVAFELDDGQWIAGAAYDGMVGTFTVSNDGAEAYVLRPVMSEAHAAEDAVARAATGAITDPYEAAALLRQEKHVDPVLGAIAAYAYARAGSIDDVRRTCFYYAKYRQALPFDAALLARIPLRRKQAHYVADIPPVPAREPRNQTEARLTYTCESTPGGSVVVAGGFPWLRQGWGLLEDNRQFRGLARFAGGLRPGVFTTLNPRFGRELAELVTKGEI